MTLDEAEKRVSKAAIILSELVLTRRMNPKNAKLFGKATQEFVEASADLVIAEREADVSFAKSASKQKPSKP